MRIDVNVTVNLSENSKEFIKKLLNLVVTSGVGPVSNIKNKTAEEKTKTENGKELELITNDIKKTNTKDNTILITTKTYTLQDLGNAAKIVLDSGRREELVKLLESFGVRALTQLDSSKYNEFANKLRELGRDI